MQKAPTKISGMSSMHRFTMCCWTDLIILGLSRILKSTLPSSIRLKLRKAQASWSLSAQEPAILAQDSTCPTGSKTTKTWRTLCFSSQTKECLAYWNSRCLHYAYSMATQLQEGTFLVSVTITGLCTRQMEWYVFLSLSLECLSHFRTWEFAEPSLRHQSAQSPFLQSRSSNRKPSKTVWLTIHTRLRPILSQRSKPTQRDMRNLALNAWQCRQTSVTNSSKRSTCAGTSLSQQLLMLFWESLMPISARMSPIWLPSRSN